MVVRWERNAGCGRQPSCKGTNRNYRRISDYLNFHWKIFNIVHLKVCFCICSAGWIISETVYKPMKACVLPPVLSSLAPEVVAVPRNDPDLLPTSFSRSPGLTILQLLFFKYLHMKAVTEIRHPPDFRRAPPSVPATSSPLDGVSQRHWKPPSDRTTHTLGSYWDPTQVLLTTGWCQPAPLKATERPHHSHAGIILGSYTGPRLLSSAICSTLYSVQVLLQYCTGPSVL